MDFKIAIICGNRAMLLLSLLTCMLKNLKERDACTLSFWADQLHKNKLDHLLINQKEGNVHSKSHAYQIWNLLHLISYKVSPLRISFAASLNHGGSRATT
jgi:hypothetical protein